MAKTKSPKSAAEPKKAAPKKITIKKATTNSSDDLRKSACKVLNLCYMNGMVGMTLQLLFAGLPKDLSDIPQEKMPELLSRFIKITKEFTDSQTELTDKIIDLLEPFYIEED